MISNTTYNMELDIFEIGYILEEVDTRLNDFAKLYIPKIMPLVRDNNIDTSSTIINKNILLNDPSSLPNINFTVKTSNYLTVPFSDGVYKNTILKKGSKVDVYIPNKNIKCVRIVKL